MARLEDWTSYIFWAYVTEFLNDRNLFSTEDAGIQLDAVHTNLVDAIWTEASGRPKPNPRPIYIHDIAYAGNNNLILHIYQKINK